jgi:hypothetical protein
MGGITKINAEVVTSAGDHYVREAVVVEIAGAATSH